MPLIVEVNTGVFGWTRAAVLNPGDPVGSVSDCHDGRRDVILFRCEPERSVIYLSAAGADYESGPERIVVTLGTRELAVLADGESFERAVTTDRGKSCTVRWRHTRLQDTSRRTCM